MMILFAARKGGKRWDKSVMVIGNNGGPIVKHTAATEVSVLVGRNTPTRESTGR
jgi:hypothetical protein